MSRSVVPASLDEPATLVAIYPEPARLALRTSISGWSDPIAPSELLADRAIFRLEVPRGETLGAKVVRDSETWMQGRNVGMHRGEKVEIHPWFDADAGVFGPHTTLAAGALGDLRFRCLLPPSYLEHRARRYPVVYALDGQALFSDSTDPFGRWDLDVALDGLWELRAVQQIIVVAIETAQDRLDLLSPIADPKHGGGRGDELLKAIVEVLKPEIDRAYRTKPTRERTAILGSSMGGLFAFYAAWMRPDIFGAAAALSGSFWWADRFAVRLARGDTCPAPRPRLYLDSGASLSDIEDDVSGHDGFLHTQAMVRALTAHCYEPGVDLHAFAFPGARHDPGSWSARVSLPLQMLFPPKGPEYEAQR